MDESQPAPQSLSENESIQRCREFLFHHITDGCGQLAPLALFLQAGRLKPSLLEVPSTALLSQQRNSTLPFFRCLSKSFIMCVKFSLWTQNGCLWCGAFMLGFAHEVKSSSRPDLHLIHQKTQTTIIPQTFASPERCATSDPIRVPEKCLSLKLTYPCFIQPNTGQQNFKCMVY